MKWNNKVKYSVCHVTSDILKRVVLDPGQDPRTHCQWSSGAASCETQSHLRSTRLPSHSPNVRSIYEG